MVFCICYWLCKSSRLAVLCFGFGTVEWAALFLTAWSCQPEAKFDINCVVFVFLLLLLFQPHVAEVYSACRKVSDCPPYRGDVAEISSDRDSSGA